MFVSAHISVSFQDIHTCAIPDLTKAEVSAAANSKKKANITLNRIFSLQDSCLGISILVLNVRVRNYDYILNWFYLIPK